MKTLKYEEGDIVGVCGDRMYEFEIFMVSEAEGSYGGKCIRSSKGALVEKGTECKIEPEQIVVLLGKNGKKFDL